MLVFNLLSQVVAHHNRLRSRIASGSTRLPAAADMRELQWDPELAKVAQRFKDLFKRVMR